MVGGCKKCDFKDRDFPLLEMTKLSSGWKELNVPYEEKHRIGHLAFLVNETEKALFCGEIEN